MSHYTAAHSYLQAAYASGTKGEPASCSTSYFQQPRRGIEDLHVRLEATGPRVVGHTQAVANLGNLQTKRMRSYCLTSYKVIAHRCF